MFVKGQKIDRGAHLSAETKAKVIADRKAGKKWKDIAKDLNIPTKRAMTYAKRKWYKTGVAVEVKEKENPVVEVKTDDKNIPTVDTEKGKEGKNKESKENDTKDKGVVEKVKQKAAKNIDNEVTKQIKKSDKAPQKVKPSGDVKKEAGVVDKEAKKGVSDKKPLNIWFLVAIILAIATIGIIFIVIKPKGEEKTDYNKPTEEKSRGFEGRSIEDL